MNHNNEIKSFREMAERFAERSLAPTAIKLDNYPFVEFNRAALDAARDTGLFNVLLAEDRGGVGQGMETLAEMLLALARADGSFAAVVFTGVMAQEALCSWGADQLVERHAGKSIIGMPIHDLPNDLQKTATAKQEGDGWKLDGTIEYVTLAPVADALLLPAMVDGRVALFLAETGGKGLSVSKPVVSLGLRGCPVADVSLDGARLPSESLLTKDAETDYPVLAARFRAAAAALAVGVCEGSYQAAKQYAKERYQAGSMIIEHDMVRMMLAGMAVVAETGKEIARNMARAADAGNPWPISDAGFILFSEQAARATTDGVQILGGYGYMEDYGQEKRMRDAKQVENIFGAAPAKRLELIADILRQEE